jgi:transcriptional regulator of heat shock response
MEAIGNRRAKILEASIETYIQTGRPVTSNQLYRLYNFGIKPAMIRWELNSLDGAGYLVQVHPSGGRVPTNKAYRLFVKAVLEKINESNRETFFESGRLAQYIINRRWQRLVEDLSQELQLLSVGYELAMNRIYESGFTELFYKLDVQAKEDWISIAEDFDFLSRRLENLRKKWQRNKFWPKVFVGKNPLTKSQHLALIAEKFEVNNEPLILLAIGPKRMDYQKSLKLFKNLKQRICRNK